MIDAGSGKGIQAGQQFYIRRTVINRYENASGRHSAVTAGWLTITAATENTAIGRIDFACDGIQAGDYLEPTRRRRCRLMSIAPMPLVSSTFRSPHACFSAIMAA